MRKTVWVATALFSFALPALAQNRVDTEWRCANPSAIHSLAAGDMPNHNFTIIQDDCRSTASEAQAVWNALAQLDGRPQGDEKCGGTSLQGKFLAFIQRRLKIASTSD